MRMSIAIVPGLFVAVLTARREELVEHCRQVLLKSGLEFNRADGAVVYGLSTQTTDYQQFWVER